MLDVSVVIVVLVIVVVIVFVDVVYSAVEVLVGTAIVPSTAVPGATVIPVAAIRSFSLYLMALIMESEPFTSSSLEVVSTFLSSDEQASTA